MIKKVLCVDDDSISLTISQMLLKRTGFADEVVTAIDGSDALDYFESLFAQEPSEAVVAPELILLDINMPVMNGWQFLEEYAHLRSDLQKNITIYMVSSSVDEYDIRKSKEFKTVSDYIIKPIQKEKFSQVLSSYAE